MELHRRIGGASQIDGMFWTIMVQSQKTKSSFGVKIAFAGQFPSMRSKIKIGFSPWPETCTTELKVKIERRFSKLPGRMQGGVVNIWMMLDTIIHITDDVASALPTENQGICCEGPDVLQRRDR
jgi:hypothetical protein